MKKTLLSLIVCGGMVFSLQATPAWGSPLKVKGVMDAGGCWRPEISELSISRAEEEDVNVEYEEINTSEAGQLAVLLGDHIKDITALKIIGPIDSRDFTTMWEASLYGELTCINLADAQVADRIIPANAFWNPEVQTELEPSVSFYMIRLTSIILPDDIEEIGDEAFHMAGNLVEANIPAGLRKIGRSAFEYCYKLAIDNLVIPEGVESIPLRAFDECRSITGVLTLPSTLREIGMLGFSGTKFTAVGLPDALENIGDYAFMRNRIEQLVLPASLRSIGQAAFDSQTGTDWQPCLKGVWSLSTNPPICHEDGFVDSGVGNTTDIPLYVLCGSQSSYREAAGWNRFNTISAAGLIPAQGDMPALVTFQDYSLQIDADGKLGTVTLDYMTSVETVPGAEAELWEGRPGDTLVARATLSRNTTVNHFPVEADFDGVYIDTSKTYTLVIPADVVVSVYGKALNLRREIQLGASSGIRPVSVSGMETPIYDLSGRRATESGSAVIISGGRKTLRR